MRSSPRSQKRSQAITELRCLINRWTEDHTREKIANLFPPGSLDAQTRLVLTSAIYFSGKWQEPFTTSLTQRGPFAAASGAATQANFMSRTADFGYAETPFAQILEMHYAGTGFVFDVLLPRSAAGFAALEKSMTAESLRSWLQDLSSRYVQVSLPKFRTESQFSLGDTLSAMGMPAAFSENADFSGISGQRNLAISRVVHKTYVDVFEQGTEAAAATGVAMRLLGKRETSPPIVFRADHPFLYLIRDTRSGVVLFIGRLMDPR